MTQPRTKTILAVLSGVLALGAGLVALGDDPQPTLSTASLSDPMITPEPIVTSPHPTVPLTTTTHPPPTTTTVGTLPPQPAVVPEAPPPPPPAVQGGVDGAVRATWPSQPERAVRIATCESGLDPEAIGRLGERGVMQIHPIHRPRIAAMGYSWDDMLSVAPNLVVARAIYDESGWSPWSCR